jgi:hypothetical protein
VGRFYGVTFDATSITAANTDHDLFWIAPADDNPVRLWSLSLVVTSEIAEAQEEWLRIVVIRGFTSVGSGGTAVATVPRLSLGDSAATFTARTCDTTVATTGTTQTVWATGFNVRAGMELVWLPETTPWATHANTSILVRMQNTVTDTLDMSGTLVVEEVG